MARSILWHFLALALSAACSPSALAVDPPLTLQPVATGLTQPVYVTHSPNDPRRLYIVEQRGKIKIMRDGVLLPTPLIDVGPLMTGSDAYTLEYGLLGLAFHPNFASNGYFYVNFTVGTSSLADTMVMRFRMTADPDVADLASGQVILRLPYTLRNHRAGWMDYGSDGFLYIPTGDGGENDPQNSASNLGVLAGKILRLDVNGPDGIPGTSDDDGFPADTNKNYRIPSTNPFIAQPGAMPEIWSYGLRNPWRCSFDRQTNEFWIGDVGQVAREEIDMIGPGIGGAFFGWRCMEGTQPTNYAGCTNPLPPSVAPVFDYGRDLGGATIGGYVYRGCLMPNLRGRYFFGDWTRKIWSFRLVGNTVTQFTTHTELTPATTFVSFGEDYDGELYICNWSTTAGAGNVLKIVEAGRTVPDCNANTIDDALEVCRGVSLAPLISFSPSDRVGCPALPASFSVASTGGTSFRWQRETSPNSNTWTDLADGSTGPWDGGTPGDGAIISGSSSPTLTIAPDTFGGEAIGPAHAIRYRCRVINGCGESASTPARLSLRPDLNADGAINTADLVLMLGAFGQSASGYIHGDFNADGAVNTADLVEFLGAFGLTCG